MMRANSNRFVGLIDGAWDRSSILRVYLGLLMIGLTGITQVRAGELVHHDLQVNLNPRDHRLEVTDRIRLSHPDQTRFWLHEGLEPRSLTEGVALVAEGPVAGPAPMVAYRLSMPEMTDQVTLRYAGKIEHPLTRYQESPGREQQQLSGTLSPEGIYLDAAVAWYPRFPDTLQSFSMSATLPKGWLAVSQGKGPEIETHDDSVTIHWRESAPQDDIYLVGAPYHFYRQAAGTHEAQVFLRQDDPQLAQRYLDATRDYLDLYEHLIGPYPYAKFALVENFWETGFGMPSFTLLGSRVLRLPFILRTSFPHEILHNWWGNSVYIDYPTGNWAEGLTSYLADHLLDEQRGRGAYHRRRTLQRYQDFIRQDNDFPLSQFHGRHGSASQAVGYGKALMFFHMLRRSLGDSLFIDGLRRFYRDNRFKSAGYAQWREAFEEVGAPDLKDFFEAWTQREGAPTLAVENVRVAPQEAGYALTLSLRQTQESAPFPLHVPLLVHYDGRAAELHQLAFNRREQTYRLTLPVQPRQIDIDPWYDLFRSLYAEETPPTLSGLFGARRILFVIPAQAPKPLHDAYLELARNWAEGYPEAEIREDDTIADLPEDHPVWILGWGNRFRGGFMDHLNGYPVADEDKAMIFDGKRYSRADHSFALTRRISENGPAQAWVAGFSVTNLGNLSRKLPHYGGYSYLAFADDATQNVAKGQWPVRASPLRIPLKPGLPLLQAKEPAALYPPYSKEPTRD
ncbi:MAG: M1 family aminopeptidase [Candidatus Thiodiazotropha sp.]